MSQIPPTCWTVRLHLNLSIEIMKTYKIIPLSLSYAENMDMSNFTCRANMGMKTKTPRYVWYIDGADRHILVDGGSGTRLAREFAGRTVKDVATFEESLAGIGLKPEDIDIVIQTHLHWDHVENTRKCRNAKVLVQEDEFKFAFFPHPILAGGYSSNLLKNLDFKIIKGHFEVTSGMR
jgi:glyoxylase-like metal-dependent hydrolase (beta-lactamase superfamily II)